MDVEHPPIDYHGGAPAWRHCLGQYLSRGQFRVTLGDHKRSGLGRENRQDISIYLPTYLQQSVWVGTATVVQNPFVMRSAKSLEALVSPRSARRVSPVDTGRGEGRLGNSAHSTHAV